MSTNPSAELRIALVQCAIASNAPLENLRAVERYIEQVHTQADLIVFPETISTGFSPEASAYADGVDEPQSFLQRIAELSLSYGVGVAGSLLVRDQQGVHNRFFLFDGHQPQAQWQDKRHLFSLGGEADEVIPAQHRRVFNFRGWRILPTICYDLRFPVWCRNVSLEYDLLICVANWPSSRREVWKSLLVARAIENLVYVVGVNRVGDDLLGLHYSGDSRAISPRGDVLHAMEEAQEGVIICSLPRQPLESLRAKFPVWKDADRFQIDGITNQ